MKSLGLVAGRCSDPDLREFLWKKGLGLDVKALCRRAIEIGLLGICPRTIEVSPHSPTAGFFYGLHVLSGCFHPWSSLFSRWDPPLGSLTSSFILACIRCPSSKCRVNLYKTDICPISPIPELLGMVDKAEEYGSVRGSALNGNESSFPGYS